VPDGRGGRSGVPLRPPAWPVRRHDRNHVIEVCLDLDGQVWLMLHSGSRKIGKEFVERHIGVAKTLAHNAALPDKDAVTVRDPCTDGSGPHGHREGHCTL
jgi:RNA-splicing ligase RtcB